MKKRCKIFIASLFVVISVVTIVFVLTFLPSPVTQVARIETQMSVSKSDLPREIKKIPGTELRVAEEYGGSTQDHHIVRMKTSTHQIIADLGKIE